MSQTAHPLANILIAFAQGQKVECRVRPVDESDTAWRTTWRPASLQDVANGAVDIEFRLAPSAYDTPAQTAAHADKVQVTYRYASDVGASPVRFQQYAGDALPAWATDVQPAVPPQDLRVFSLYVEVIDPVALHLAAVDQLMAQGVEHSEALLMVKGAIDVNACLVQLLDPNETIPGLVILDSSASVDDGVTD